MICKLTIAIGADHRGYQLKEFLKQKLQLQSTEISWIDVGAYNEQRSDYPLYAIEVAKAVQAGTADVGLLMCSTGVGMAIAANRFSKVYAALVWSEEIARLSKEDDHANVLVLPSDFVTKQEALTIVSAWFNASFKNDRYQERIVMIDAI